MYFGVQVVKHHPWTSQVLVQMMHMVRGRICYNLTL
jgi:predicted phosphatase